MYNHTKRLPSSIFHLQELELGDDDDDVMMALQTNHQRQH